jgi:putative cofactor-binding repeat protein
MSAAHRRQLLVFLLIPLLFLSIAMLRSGDPSTSAAAEVGLYQESSPEVVFRGGPWSQATSSADSGGSVAYTTGAQSSVSMTFSGTSIHWLARKSPKSGAATVRIDGKLMATIDLYSAQTRFSQVVFSTTTLGAGTHTIVVARTGKANPSATSTVLQFDAFNVPARTPPDAPAIVKADPHNSGIRVKWSASTSKDVVGYQVYRSTSSDGTNLQLISGTTPYSNTTFLNVDLALGTTYSYWVKAIDASGNTSPKTAQVKAKRNPDRAPSTLRATACPTPTKTVRTAEELATALDTARPGTSIWMEPGVYGRGYYVTRSGTKDKPIWVCGSSSAIIDATLNGQSHGMYLSSTSYVRLAGFSVRNSLKGVMVNDSDRVAVSDLTVQNIGHEGIHLRDTTTDSVVAGNTVRNTGMVVPLYGEGIYIGSSNKSWCTAQSCVPDRSDRNLIEANRVSGNTAEGIEAKEGSAGGWIRGNSVDGSRMRADALGLIHVRGDDWEVANNTVTNTPSYAISGMTTIYGGALGFYNQFVGNTINGRIPGYGILISVSDGTAAVACKNSAPGATSGLTNKVCQR